jgi:hypothetical protein
MAIDEARPASRRAILLGGLAAAGGLAVARLGLPEAARAAANGNVQLATGVGNTDNDAAAETRVNVTGDGQIAFSAVQPLSGTGLYGFASTAGQGVRGIGGDTATGVAGQGTNGIGVDGRSTNTAAPDLNLDDSTHRTGVFGIAGSAGTENSPGGIAANTDQTGVYGFSDMTDTAAGVWGDSWQGDGVRGYGDYGVTGVGETVGLYGDTFGTAGAYALYTNGRIKFGGRSGHTSITKGHYYKDVAIAGMTTASDIIVTLRTYKSGYSVAAAVPYAGKFRMYLNKSATSTLYFSYLVIG